MQGFWEWFVGEPGGAWIVGIAGLLLAVYQTLQMVRPDRVTYAESSRSSLLSIHPQFRDQVSATYGGTPVAALSQVEMILQNTGNGTVRRPCFRVSSPGSDILAVTVDGEFGGESAEVARDGSSVIEVRLPHLNSRAHDHCVVVRIVGSGALLPLVVTGGGEGWSVHKGVSGTRLRRLCGMAASGGLLALTVAFMASVPKLDFAGIVIGLIAWIAYFVLVLVFFRQEPERGTKADRV